MNIILDIEKQIKDIEQSFTASQKRSKGIFFTPSNIVKYILKQVIPQSIKNTNYRICDPSCGAGIFLVHAALILSKKLNKTIRQTIEENIYGIDIVEKNVEATKSILTQLIVNNGENSNNIKFNILCENSITFDWNLLPKFDGIVGNPPYIKIQDLDMNTRKCLSNNYHVSKQNFNIYFAFFELALNILVKNGKIGFITPNSFLNSDAGKELRQLLASKIKKIIDFGNTQVFESASTCTCISILSNRFASKINWIKVNNKDEIDNINSLKYTSVKRTQLLDNNWLLISTLNFNKIKKIEEAGIKIFDIVDMKVGIATLKDSLYYIQGSSYFNNYYTKDKFLIEKGITKRAIKISELDFNSKSNIQSYNDRMIFPYTISNGKASIIPEDILKIKYPECYKYLLSIKNQLAERDKGKTNNTAWYAYGRGQGLTLFGPKLLTKVHSKYPEFILDDSNHSLFYNGYGIFLKSSQVPIDIIQKILNSRIMQFYIENTSKSLSGNYWCYQTKFLEKFSIPKFTSAEINVLKNTNNSETINEILEHKYAINI